MPQTGSQGALRNIARHIFPMLAVQWWCVSLLITSEDCLYLNVWTPLDATNTSNYPVMVFIHGGSFKWGSGTNQMYDGNKLASGGKVVYMNMDYRVGLLGFLYTGDGEDDAHGNFGIQDQRLALQWVQQNIQNFGGDPNKVTLFGESAGAQSTFIHMMSPKSNGQFRAAIMESSPFAVPYRDKTDALDLTRRVRDILGCPEKDAIACLRSKTVDEINEAQEKITFKITAKKLNEYYEPIGPIVDGVELLMQPMAAAALGKYRKVPMILGTNTEEGRLFVYLIAKINLTRTEYETALAIIHPNHFEEIEKFYKTKPDQVDYRDDLSQVITDYLFTCANRNTTRNVAKRNAGASYMYVFDHATIARGGWGKDSFCEGHVCHGAELGYIFQNQIFGEPTPDEATLGESMLMYWTNFAYTLDPNVGLRSPSLTWPAYSANKTSTMHFVTPKNDLFNDYKEEYCNFWDAVGYNE